MAKSSRQVRKGTYASQRHDKLRTQVKKRQNRLVGMKRANDRLNKEPEEEKLEVSEGIASALGHLTTHVGAQAIATGLGLHPSIVHAFAAHLAKRRKEKQQITTKPKPKAAAPKTKRAKDPNANLRAFFDLEKKRKERGLL
jgi:hypothetical protein